MSQTIPAFNGNIDLLGELALQIFKAANIHRARVMW